MAALPLCAATFNACSDSFWTGTLEGQSRWQHGAFDGVGAHWPATHDSRIVRGGIRHDLRILLPPESTHGAPKLARLIARLRGRSVSLTMPQLRARLGSPR